MTSKLRIISTGLVGLYPVGGVAWDYLQYVVGLARLGHDVYYHEDTWSWPYHPVKRTYMSDPDYSIEHIEGFFDRFAPELAGKWHYRHLHRQSLGMTESEFDRIASSADLFLNVSGASMFPKQLAPRCMKVFIDTDPGYNQIVLSERFDWSENVERWCALVEGHDLFFTYAENINASDCLVPKLGYEWKTTRMPVATHLWDSIADEGSVSDAPWTTVMTWNAYKGKLLYDGTEYMSKGSEFERLFGLPDITGVRMKAAIGGVSAPMARLAETSWEVVDAPTATLTPEDYQAFIAGSRAEISPAKHVYVAMNTGWFSTRSACYLASGRPVVTQDTGFGVAIPTGEGVLSFADIKDAASGIEQIEADFDHHSRRAREIAREYFDSKAVLKRLLDDIFAGAAAR